MATKIPKMGVMCLCGAGFFSGSRVGPAGPAPLRSCSKLPRLLPDPLVAQAKPLSNGGSASGKTDFRRRTPSK